ncbi:hypothetical protein J1605_023190 [Eschrichtius robustus]|uniref:Uncharacterized protein n=1 Tax=Eschrichtius robustus TaxID=9764 RepID=A0AB34H7N6_ESCRO|nr:hypothetical protein J1605_023190 [Eschrichtius robustus]
MVVEEEPRTVTQETGSVLEAGSQRGVFLRGIPGGAPGGLPQPGSERGRAPSSKRPPAARAGHSQGSSSETEDRTAGSRLRLLPGAAGPRGGGAPGPRRGPERPQKRDKP